MPKTVVQIAAAAAAAAAALERVAVVVATVAAGTAVATRRTESVEIAAAVSTPSWDELVVRVVQGVHQRRNQVASV